MRTFASVLLLAAIAAAQPAPIPVHFDAGAIDMVPGLDGGQRYRLKRWLNGPVKQVGQSSKQINDLNNRIKKERNKDKKKALQDQRAKAVVQRDALRRKARAEYDKLEIKPETLARLNRMPKGELRRERYNHAVMLEAPDLSATQIERIHACIAATDSAQLALALQKRNLKRTLADQDPKVLRRMTNDLNNRIRAIEKRYWVAMHYVLTPDQMRATKKLRSPRYQYVGDHRNHLAMLPGLSATQGGRILSLLNEITSETAADDAVIRSLQARMKEKDADRKALQNELSAAYQRRGRIYTENRKAIRDLLTEEQANAWDAIPPQMAGGDVGRGVMSNLNGIVLEPGQDKEMRTRAAAMQKRLREAQKEHAEKTKALRESGMGSDSPQMMMMNMMNRGLQGDYAREYRDLGHEYCVEVFSSAQLATWIATGPVKP